MRWRCRNQQQVSARKGVRRAEREAHGKAMRARGAGRKAAAGNGIIGRNGSTVRERV